MTNTERPIVHIIPLSWAAGSLLTTEEIEKKFFSEPRIIEVREKFKNTHREFFERVKSTTKIVPRN